MPDVDHPGAGLRKDERALDRHALVVEARLAVGLEHRAMRGHPACVPAAAGELPGAGDLVAVRHGDRAAGRVRRPHCQQCARIGRENVTGSVGVKTGTSGRGHRHLRDAPGGAGIGRGDLLDRLDIARRRQLIGRGVTAGSASGTGPRRAARPPPASVRAGPRYCGAACAIIGATQAVHLVPAVDAHLALSHGQHNGHKSTRRRHFSRRIEINCSRAL